MLLLNKSFYGDQVMVLWPEIFSFVFTVVENSSKMTSPDSWSCRDVALEERLRTRQAHW